MNDTQGNHSAHEEPARVDGSAAGTWTQRAWYAWEQFWFAPADPTRLGLIRIGTGVVAFLTLLSYTADLQEFMGKHAWHDLSMRLEEVRDLPNERIPLAGSPLPPPPANAMEERYRQDYLEKFHEPPPGPYPQDERENQYVIAYRATYGVDVRKYGMPIPKTPGEDIYVQQFALRHLYKVGYPDAPAPPYPRDDQEKREIFEYLDRQGKDLHRLVTRGQAVFSLWFYVTDPAHMQILHALVLFVTVLFTLGFCTRLTAALTWFFNLGYVVRSPYSLFGADTMINILLLYLMLGPSGSALSLDRRILRWWSGHKLAVVNRWRALWHKPALSAAELAPSVFPETPPPSVGANTVVRLMQIHLCIVYLIAGLSKFGGPSWWNGTAIWRVMVHPELAPMHLKIYDYLLRLLARNETVFYLVLFVGTYFTLVFEVGYPFLIWTRLRRLILIGAVVLHGLIGVVMGLQTFTLIMLVMNGAFLTEDETHWLLGWWRRWPFFRKGFSTS